MVNIKPIVNAVKLVTRKSSSLTSKYAYRPQMSVFSPENLKSLRIAKNEFRSCTDDNFSGLKEIRSMFPTGKLEDNFFINDIKDLLGRIVTTRRKIDLEPHLSMTDYSIMQKFIDMDGRRFVQQWKGFSNTDSIPNAQKLAIFTRTMRLTEQVKEFLSFNSNQWEIVYEGIIKKPRESIIPILEYKADSKFINNALSGFDKITPEMKNTIDRITEYLNSFTVKNDFIAYRGDETYNILSGIKVDGMKISLPELIEKYSAIFQDMHIHDKYNVNMVNDFAKRYLIAQKIYQPRFMSIGMTERATEKYAKKIKWKITIPKGTKGASIESYNVEREHEAEFLGQRNGALKIRGAVYEPKEGRWHFDATLEQLPIDEIKVNC